MRILIAGAGKIGVALAQQLSKENHEIVVIDRNGDVLETELNRYDVMTVEGNRAVMKTLEEVDITSFDLMVACTLTGLSPSGSTAVPSPQM